MRILIIGATGMLGHDCCEHFLKFNSYEVYATCRNYEDLAIESHENLQVYDDVDILVFERIKELILSIKPDLVINCAGAIKQKEIGINPIQAIEINGLFPHKLTTLAEDLNFKLVLVSTDCVFNGKKGMYTEDDASDCNDIYGKSKYIGEIVDNENVLTIRTSIIGLEKKSNLSLLSWFLSQSGEVNGFKNAIYSGVPTFFLAEFIRNNYKLSGLYQLSSQPISKFELLHIFKDYFNHNIEINEDTFFSIDRSLQSSKLEKEIGFKKESWESLIKFFPKEV